MAEPSAPRAIGGNIVGWVAGYLPNAIAWAEADLLATRRARRYHSDVAVRTGRCAVGHAWRDGIGEARHGGDCGYCVNAAEHARLWVPPVGPPVATVPPC